MKHVSLTPEEAKKIVELVGADGHSLYDPQMFIEAGINRDFVASVTRRHVSDRSSPKSTIFADDGSIIDELPGSVASLEILDSACRVLNLPVARHYFGRGRLAQACVEAIKQL